jgi:hypothetical protein
MNGRGDSFQKSGHILLVRPDGIIADHWRDADMDNAVRVRHGAPPSDSA